MNNSILITLILSMTATPTIAQQPLDPSGIWMRDDGNARVRIAPCGSNICATNLWIGDTSKGEETGDRLVMTLKPKSSDTLSGTAYDVKRGQPYSMTVQVKKNGLVTRGCVLAGMLCKKAHWASVQ